MSVFLSACLLLGGIPHPASAAGHYMEGEEDVSLAPKEVEAGSRQESFGSDGNLIVTLDPGHGGEDSGASYEWDGLTVDEKDLNLKIALACKRELEQYDGVTVYLTREDDTALALSDRVVYADSVQSDLMVSLHNNVQADEDDPSPTAIGALVILPNGNYRPELLPVSEKVAGNILDNLSELGIINNGYLQRDSTSKSYPDGSAADYYSIVRNATLKNIPSMIVEHAFLSNYDDYINFLSTDDKLEALGVADAQAIAKAYGLKLTSHSAAAVGDAPFTDVYLEDYYYDPVVWAFENGITSGTSSTTFSPANACNRAQIVSFLWSAAGKPEPESQQTAFTDVAADAWYETAVRWAVENQITAGTSETTFSPNAACTRAQCAVFLWKAAGAPQPGEDAPTFADVAPSDYCYTAVRWAAEQGITVGTGQDTFSPDQICSRAEIVTFLYRAFAAPA